MNRLIKQRPCYIMDNEIKKYLFDIQESINSIERYLGDIKDFNLYKANKMLRRAVEREFEIIGEAMNRIDKLDSKLSISGKTNLKYAKQSYSWL